MATAALSTDEMEPDLEPRQEPKTEKRRAKESQLPQERLSAPIKQIQADEDKSLRDWLIGLGPAGSIKIQVYRESPETVFNHETGQDVQCAGHLHTYDEVFDEEFLRTEWGGGTYKLKITKRTDDGSFRYERGQGFSRKMKVAGSPRTDRLPGQQRRTPAAPAAPVGENPSLAKAALETMERQLERLQSDPRRDGELSPAIQMMLENMNRQLSARDAELAAMRAEVSAARNAKPPENPIMDKFLTAAIDGNSGQVESLRLRQEAELRMLKEQALAEVKRIEDRHDRQTSEMRVAHESAMMSLRQSFEREIAAMRTSHEVAIAAAKAAADVQRTTLESEIRRYDKDNEQLRRDVAILREKKDKSLFDSIKEIKLLKEVMGDDSDDGEEKGTLATLVGALTPENIAAAAGVIKGGAAAVAGAAQPAQVNAQPAPQRPRVVQDRRTGQHFATTQQGQLVPVKRKPKVVAGPDGQQVEVPAVDPEQLAQLISYLETAFRNDVDPQLVAQSGRGLVPPDVLAWLAQNDSEEHPGVDLFMGKVAKLPSSSPLASQAGKNWVRKVGRALIG